MYSKTSFYVLIILIGFGFISCKSKTSSNDAIQGIPSGSLSDFIQNPVSAYGTDTVNIAKIQFEENIFDFGTVNEGEIVEHEFVFRNTGKQPLIISTANSTCGCTVPEWPRTAIDPGGTESIMVRFNTTGKPNKQSKPVSIFANTYPNETKVFLRGNVKPKQEK
jgi:hypothetical protein